MPVNLSLTTYIIAGLILAILVLSGMYWVQGKELRVTKAEYAAFVANTAAAGEKSKAEWAGKSAHLANEITNLEKELNDAKTGLDKSYANYNRLRHDKSASSSTPNLSETASKFDCTDEGATKLARNLERFETGVIDRLLRSRDDAIIRAQACREWLIEQDAILSGNPAP